MYSSGNGSKQILHVDDDTLAVTHIADAGDPDKAHFLATAANERSSNYIRQALVTLSPSFFGEKVSKAHFVGRVNGAIDALNKLDQIKKTLFYGRDNNLEPAEGAKDVAGLNERVGSGGVNGANIIHAIIGVATEAGELLEALKADYNRDTANTMDSVNIREEVGDLFWYLAILAHEVGFEFEDCMRTNIAKLRLRYADKFDRVDANERDLAAERAVLEGNGGDYAPGFADEAVVNSGSGVHSVEEMNVAMNTYIVPSEPASGKPAVKAADEASRAAFIGLANVGKARMVETNIKSADDISKGIGERLTPMAGEKLSRQLIRDTDISGE